MNFLKYVILIISLIGLSCNPMIPLYINNPTMDTLNIRFQTTPDYSNKPIILLNNVYTIKSDKKRKLRRNASKLFREIEPQSNLPDTNKIIANELKTNELMLFGYISADFLSNFSKNIEMMNFSIEVNKNKFANDTLFNYKIKSSIIILEPKSFIKQ